MVRNIPIEVFENKAPIRFDQLSLREDSAGADKHRGGLGIRRDFRVLEPVGVLSIIQKTRTDNWGLNGGEPGKKNVVVLQSSSTTTISTMATANMWACSAATSCPAK